MEVTCVILKIFVLFQILFFNVSSRSTSAYPSCSGGQILCGDSICYSGGRCDGIPDCPNKTDESNCTSHTLPPQCPEQQKLCPDGSCIHPKDNCTIQTTPMTLSDTASTSFSSTPLNNTLTSSPSMKSSNTFPPSSNLTSAPYLEEAFSPWKIVLIVIAVLAFLVILIIVFYVCYKTHRN